MSLKHGNARYGFGNHLIFHDSQLLFVLCPFANVTAFMFHEAGGTVGGLIWTPCWPSLSSPHSGDVMYVKVVNQLLEPCNPSDMLALMIGLTNIGYMRSKCLVMTLCNFPQQNRENTLTYLQYFKNNNRLYFNHEP